MDIQELIKKYKELGFDEMEIGVAEEFAPINEEVKPESKEADKANMEQAEYKEIKAKTAEVDGDTIAKKLLKQLESLQKINEEEYTCEDDLGLYIINDGRMYNKYCRPAQKDAEAGKEVDWLKIAVEGARRYKKEIENVKFGPDKLKATAEYIKDYYEKDIKKNESLEAQAWYDLYPILCDVVDEQASCYGKLDMKRLQGQSIDVDSLKELFKNKLQKLNISYTQDQFDEAIRRWNEDLNESVDTSKLFDLDDKIANVENELVKIRQEIEKIPAGSTLTDEQAKLFERRRQADRLLTRLNAQRDKVLGESLNESKINEISLELADKVNTLRRKDAVLKTVNAKKAELAAESGIEKEPETEDDILLGKDNIDVKTAQEIAKEANIKAKKNDKLFAKWKKSKGIEESISKALDEQKINEISDRTAFNAHLQRGTNVDAKIDQAVAQKGSYSINDIKGELNAMSKNNDLYSKRKDRVGISIEDGIESLVKIGFDKLGRYKLGVVKAAKEMLNRACDLGLAEPYDFGKGKGKYTTDKKVEDIIKALLDDKQAQKIAKKYANRYNKKLDKPIRENKLGE